MTSARKARAVAVFTVEARRIRIRVRVLPTISDVDEAYHGGSRKIALGRVHSYFHGPKGGIGTIVLPADGRLDELVPHEVVHAVLRAVGLVESCNDEEVALAVGLLVAMINVRLVRRGVRVGVTP